MLLRTMVIAGIAALFVTTLGHAKMYRWVDENGTTVYSQSPPPDGKAATEIKARKYPKPAPAPEKTEDDKEEDNSADAETDKEKKKELARRKAESDEIKAENCKAARNNLQIYKDIGTRVLKTPDGLYQRLTDEEREKRIKEEKKRVKEFCE
ncbi:MAG: DUF4124 domain-containing protein [Chromatiales bacterium]|nr:DUF4124 domain-containing protein [Chromatiales bacterium]